MDGKSADRVPADYQATDEVTARLLDELSCSDETALWRKLNVDGRVFLEPEWKLPHHPEDPQADMWGVRYRKVDYGTGTYDEPSHHPLAGAESPADVHAHRWPSPDDFDYASIRRAVDDHDGYYPLHAGHFEPFLLYGYMRGLEEHAQTRYFFAFALCLSATIGVATAANLATFFIFYEMLTVATYPLVIHK